MKDIIRKPSAFIPIMMSVIAFLFLIIYLVFYGVNDLHQSSDEGTAARIFQLLISGQLPMILYFFFRWFFKKPKQVFWVIILQIISAAIPLFVVYLLEL